MPTISFQELIPALQESVGPVILISGVGLVLLTLTNRFGRAVDRSRQLAREMRDVSGADRERLAREVKNIYRRAGLIRIAVVMGATCLLFVALLIIVLFCTALLKVEAGLLIAALFVACMASLIVCLVAFIMEVQLSLNALKLELEHARGDVK
jgi:hypothetical protein